MATTAQPNFLDESTARAVAEQFGTPVYVYDQATLLANAAAVLAFPNAYGLTCPLCDEGGAQRGDFTALQRGGPAN
jgi:hypothetical protein